MENPEQPLSPPDGSTAGYPAKPELVERSGNAVRRSVITLLIYGLLFYFIFERNLSYVATILVVIIIHELGHFAVMRIFGYSNPRMFILPLPGTTGRSKSVIGQRKLVTIVLAGPLPGIIIGSILLYLNRDIHHETLKILASSFLIINLLNALPFYPLDGGRLLETLFQSERYTVRLVFGIIAVAVMTLLFLLLFSPLLLIIPFLMMLDLNNERKHQRIREYLSQEGLRYRCSYRELTNREYWLIRDCLLFSFPRKFAGINPGQYEYSLLEPVIIQQINAVLLPEVKSDMKAASKFFVVVFYLLMLTIPAGLMYLYR